MKKTILSILLLGLSMIVQPVIAAPVIKEVCKSVTDNAGNTKVQCKKIKVHKKLKGTKVPVKK